MEVAVALGADPVTTYAGSMPLPRHIDELAVAGVLRGERVELVACKTIELEVPANAEIVIEGYVRARRARSSRGRSATTPATTRPPSRSRSCTSRRSRTAATRSTRHRRRRPPAEDVWLGKATERIFLPRSR